MPESGQKDKSKQTEDVTLTAAEKALIHEQLYEAQKSHVKILYTIIGLGSTILFAIITWAWALAIDVLIKNEDKLDGIRERLATLEERLKDQ